MGVPAGGLAAATAPMRHSDPGSSPEATETADVTLSGDLERLSQHLQSARAMYDAAPARAQDGGARLADGSYRQQQGRRYSSLSTSAISGSLADRSPNHDNQWQWQYQPGAQSSYNGEVQWQRAPGDWSQNN